jgi:hypothetical protein
MKNNKFQAPSTKNQITVEIPIFGLRQKIVGGLEALDIGKLEFVWDLEFGDWKLISHRYPCLHRLKSLAPELERMNV